jgi:hypothetical protein
MSNLSRRAFIAGTLGTVTGAAVAAQPAAGKARPATAVETAAAQESVNVHWLGGGAHAETLGVTWGVPWPAGKLPPDQAFTLRTEGGEAIPIQTWPIGYWPDGSLKWSAHAVGGGLPSAETYVLATGAPTATVENTVSVRSGKAFVEVDTGVIRCRVGTRGGSLIQSITRADGREIVRRGQLICLAQDSIPEGEESSVRRKRFTGDIDSVTVEQSGPVRAVVRVDGKHRGKNGRAWLPFTVRLYFYAGAESVRIVHTFVFDGKPERDFICGLGVRFHVPMRDELYDRHVRLAGEGGGMLADAVKGISGLRRNPGDAVKTAQVAGQPTPPVATWDTRVSSRLHLIPSWGDYSLSQLSADGFHIRKRTKAGHGWIDVGAGGRADGFGYVGGITGGLAFGMRDFWERHPSQLDIRHADSDEAEATIWLWSPEARPMDLRFYHDGMGQDTYAEQLEGLEITYEDYEPGWDTPVGIARTTELAIWALDATPSTEHLAELAKVARTPPLLMAPPAHLHAAGVFGDWSPVDRSTPARTVIEDRLDLLLGFYQKQIDQHRWYGFWNYGDVMHGYDFFRHQWRYDVGGYAWDNSELSPDLWLWYSFLRTGRADVYRMAEAMTRHTGEVDVYHLGRFKDLGTRHGVQHWGDSAKQARISTAAYRRFFYFLTADERTGDLLHNQVYTDRTFLTIDPSRKVRTGPYEPDPHALSLGLGNDWGAMASAWLTEWERGGDPIAKTKLLNSMRSIGALPYGHFTSGALYDLDTGEYHAAAPTVGISHLWAVFGKAEICSELIQLVDMPAFKQAWLQYCRLYNATGAEQQAELGRSLGSLDLRQAHSRLTAYAAAQLDDERLAQRAWTEFKTGAAGYPDTMDWNTWRIEPPHALNPVEELTWVSTNATAQYGLAAIQTLALVGDHLS